MPRKSYPHGHEEKRGQPCNGQTRIQRCQIWPCGGMQCMPYVQAQASACAEESVNLSDKPTASGNGTGTATSQHSTASMRTGSQRTYLSQGESQIASISCTASIEESYIWYAQCSPRWTGTTGNSYPQRQQLPVPKLQQHFSRFSNREATRGCGKT